MEMKDYLARYTSDTGFDFGQLIHDDFYEAIKLCYNNQKYISCAKLLVCFIDTLGFIRFGDEKNAYVGWLDEYTDLSILEIESRELWEYRNALIHTTTMKSRKIHAGKHPVLIAYMGELVEKPEPPQGEKWFSLDMLIKIVIPHGLAKFSNEFITSNLEIFIERYDQILSDQRYQCFYKEEGKN
jgi:hypothetical protein